MLVRNLLVSRVLLQEAGTPNSNEKSSVIFTGLFSNNYPLHFLLNQKEIAMFTATKDNPANANDLGDAASRAKKDTYRAAYQAGEGIRDVANQSARKVRNFFSSATDEAQNAAKNLNDRIEDNPKQAVLVSLCAGFLLGALVRR
jgi:ElaB/YqjD/DUF883 family membrane-anchored ribosome-binding protein